jgi:hypothetical protein
MQENSKIIRNKIVAIATTLFLITSTLSFKLEMPSRRKSETSASQPDFSGRDAEVYERRNLFWPLPHIVGGNPEMKILAKTEGDFHKHKSAEGGF